MSSDFQEIGQVSQNLSLRRSPERKNAPRYFSSSANLSTSYKTRRRYNCCPPICCHYCCCYHYCCCCHCYNPCCLNFDYSSANSSDELKKPNENPKDGINSSPLKGSNINQSNQSNSNPPVQMENSYFSYEQNQFNEFLKKLMESESKIEDAKINLASNPDFNCEDAFALFETNNKNYIDENDLKNGLNNIGISATDEEIRLLMKRFDLQKSGYINYADFFDIVVPFEKSYRMRVESRYPKSDLSPNTVNELKELFNLIINLEIEINNMRKLFGTLRLNLRNVFGQVDKTNSGHFKSEELIDYLDNNRLLTNRRDPDLLFIRLDKNRNGRIDFSEVEDELQTIY